MDFKLKIYKEIEKKFISLGYEKIMCQSGYLYLKEDKFGFEGIRTSQVVTAKTYNQFFISLSIYRRYNVIEEPLSQMLSMFPNANKKISKTISISINAINDIKCDEFYESESGRLVFNHDDRGVKNLIGKLDYYSQELKNKLYYFNDIRNIDAIINSSFELNETITNTFADCIPISIKRIFIARLANNPIENEFLIATKKHFIYESEKYEDGFKEIFINYLNAIEKLETILIHTRPLKNVYLLEDDENTRTPLS